MPVYNGYTEFVIEAEDKAAADEILEEAIKATEHLSPFIEDVSGDNWEVATNIGSTASMLEPPADHPDVMTDDEFLESLTPASREQLQAWFGDDSPIDNSSSSWYSMSVEDFSPRKEGVNENMNIINQIAGIEKAASSNSNSKSSSSTKKPEPSTLTKSDIYTQLAAIETARLTIDDQARKNAGDDLDQQAKVVQLLSKRYDALEKKLRDILGRIEKAEDEQLEKKGARNYGLYADDGNIRLTVLMDSILEEAAREQDELKERVSTKVRQAMTEVANEGHEEVWETPVRDKVYADLVDDGIIAAFEPMEF